MRVLHVIPGLAARTGGPAVGLVEALLALEPLGVSATVLTTDLSAAAGARASRPVSADELPGGADRLDIRIFPARMPRRLAFSPALDAAVAAEVRSFDLVRIHSLYLYPQYAAYRHASRAGVPYMLSPHGSLDPYLRERGRLRKRLVDALWQGRLLAGAAALHVTTVEEAALIADVAPDVPRVVIPNGIVWRRFQTLPDGQAFRNRRLKGFDGRVVLHLGRVARKKGLDVLVRALAGMPRRFDDVRLVLAGPDDEGLETALRRLARDLGVAERVVFTGMIYGDEKLSALAAATVWALPSHTENFAIAAVEAMAAGVPTIISPAVNIAPDASAENATVVADAIAETFGAAIASLLDDDASRLDLAERGRDFARRYDWDRIAPKLVDAYRSIIESRVAA